MKNGCSKSNMMGNSICLLLLIFCDCSGFDVHFRSSRRVRLFHPQELLIVRGGPSPHRFQEQRKQRHVPPISFLGSKSSAVVHEETGESSATSDASSSPDTLSSSSTTRRGSLPADVERLLQEIASSEKDVNEQTYNFNDSTFHAGLNYCFQTADPQTSLQLIQAMTNRPVHPSDTNRRRPTPDDYGLVVLTLCRSSSDSKFLKIALQLVESHVDLPVAAYDAVLSRLDDWKAALHLLRTLERRSSPLSSLQSADPNSTQNAVTAPVVSTYRVVVEACVAAGQAEPANQVLQSCLDRGLTTSPTMVSLFEVVISSFSKRRQWRRSLQLLDQMKEKNLVPNVACFNSILAAMSKAREADPALALLSRMKRDYPTTVLHPDLYSYNSVLAAAASNPRRWKEALRVFDDCQRQPGVNPDVYSYSNAIRACAKGGQIQRALALLQVVKDKRLPIDAYCYTAAMEACSKAKMWQRALELFSEMQVVYHLKPNEVAYSVCISACANSGQWRKALELLDDMREKGIRINLITYNAAITACSKAAKQKVPAPQEPLWPRVQLLLRQIREGGLQPDGFSYSSAITCCGAEGRWQEALALIEEMKSGGPETRPNKLVYSAAIDSCGKAGQVEHALRLFQEMREQRISVDRVAWNAMFSALRVGKRGETAYAMWREMIGESQNVQINSRSNVTKPFGVKTADMAAPDIITVTNAIAAVSSEEGDVSQKRVDEMFRDAVDRGIILRSNLDSTWDFDLSGMSLPVARAACRLLLTRIALTHATDDVQDLTFITGVGINHGKRLSIETTLEASNSSRDISLRDFVQGVLVNDFDPPLSSDIPGRAKGTVRISKAALRSWISNRTGVGSGS